MTLASEAREVINAAVRFISDNQKTDGSFVSLSSPDKEFRDSITLNTTFFTSNILACLNGSEARQQKIIGRAKQFLLEQKSEVWSFNYWSRNAVEHRSMPYPDDLDDTFCALGALTLHDKGVFTGEVLAKISKVLIAAEQQPGGPYRTWMVNSSAEQKWHDVDCAVNSNIAWFLAQHNVTLPNINTYIEQAVARGTLYSPYYPAVLPLLYFISRFYRGPLREQLITMVQAELAPDICVQDLAMIAISLYNLNAPQSVIALAVNRLIELYKIAGWQASPFCYDPA